MNIRLIGLALAIIALGAAACGKGDPSKPANNDAGSSSPGYDLPTPPADDEKKK